MRDVSVVGLCVSKPPGDQLLLLSFKFGFVGVSVIILGSIQGGIRRKADVYAGNRMLSNRLWESA